MKKTLLSILALTALTASADGFKAGFSSVELRSQSGETTTVTLTDAMTTTFTATDVVFADGTTTVTMPLAQLRSYTFVEAVVPEGITEVPTVQDGITAIYTADGRRVDSTNMNQPGLYIVKCGKSTLKVYRK